MKNLFHNWNFARVLRLVIGGAFLAAGISSGEWIAFVAGGIFSIQGLFGLGCCASGCATVPPNRTSTTGVQEVNYEEVH
jgi:hypothetical protein